MSGDIRGWGSTTPLLALYRERSRLKFELEHARNRRSWSIDDLERGVWASLVIELTWRIIGLDEMIREREYGVPDRLELEAGG